MMKKLILALICVLLAVPTMAQKNIYNFKVKAANERMVKLKDYKGKVLLIVNTATQCGFTPQYEALQKLYDTYKAQGLVVLDFPCNQFGGQAPGSLSEIKAFCTGNYGVTFPQFDKIEVNGKNEQPLYSYLKAQQGFKDSIRIVRLESIWTKSSASKTLIMRKIQALNGTLRSS